MAEILQLIIVGLTVVMTIISLAVSLIKNSKSKQFNGDKLYETTMDLIDEAEQVFGPGKGNNKLSFVLRQLMALFPGADENGLRLLINRIVDLTKNVNTKEQEGDIDGIRITNCGS